VMLVDRILTRLYSAISIAVPVLLRALVIAPHSHATRGLRATELTASLAGQIHSSHIPEMMSASCAPAARFVTLQPTNACPASSQIHQGAPLAVNCSTSRRWEISTVLAAHQILFAIQPISYAIQDILEMKVAVQNVPLIRSKALPATELVAFVLKTRSVTRPRSFAIEVISSMESHVQHAHPILTRR